MAKMSIGQRERTYRQGLGNKGRLAVSVVAGAGSAKNNLFEHAAQVFVLEAEEQQFNTLE